MTSLLKNFQQTRITQGQLLIGWLGLSGFLIKSSNGSYLVIDAYLSDLCERVSGIYAKRIMPPPLAPEELGALPLAAYLATHHHEDHLDTDCIRSLVSPTSFPFLSTPTSVRLLRDMGVESARCIALRPGETHLTNEWSVHAVFADHGDMAPDAIGFVIRCGDLTVYHMGDTCFHADEFADIAAKFEIDLLLVPINGRYGNMDEIAALKALQILKPKIVSPMHFWLLASNNGGDLERFLREAPYYSSASRIQLFTQGEVFLLDKR